MGADWDTATAMHVLLEPLDFITCKAALVPKAGGI